MLVVEREIVRIALQQAERASGRHVNDARNALHLGRDHHIGRTGEINRKNFRRGPITVAGKTGDVNDRIDAGGRLHDRVGVKNIVAGCEIEATHLMAIV